VTQKLLKYHRLKNCDLFSGMLVALAFAKVFGNKG
jgi:hypothetical protein